jgi:hypothetical protein
MSKVLPNYYRQDGRNSHPHKKMSKVLPNYYRQDDRNSHPHKKVKKYPKLLKARWPQYLILKKVKSIAKLL